MITIPLTHGKKAIVCDCHYELVREFKWHISTGKNAGYAHRTKNIGDHKFKTFKMHRVINGTPDGMITDHINGDKLDNRCSNLRTATRNINSMNSKMFSTNTSGIKGVGWMKQCHKWRADIGVNGKLVYLGLFDTIEEAANARKKAEILYHKEFAGSKC